MPSRYHFFALGPLGSERDEGGDAVAEYGIIGGGGN